MVSILGISAFYHDSAACLLLDGEIVAAAQEERFTRIKHDYNFPRQAARYCLSEANLNVNNLDYVRFYDKPLLKFDRPLETYLDYAPSGFQSFLKSMPLWMKQKLWMPDLIKTELAKTSGKDNERAAKKAGKAFSWKHLFGDIEKLIFNRSEIPALTHVDYSARIQTVRRETNPLYWEIIEAFRVKTGCPVIVNTSFNVRGEPIVCTPEDS